MVLRRIHGSLPPEITNTVACAIVGARLDYCNSILYGTSEYNISRLQRMQNTRARVVTRTKKFDHITPVLRCLHWLPIQCGIECKVAMLALKIRETGQPSNLSHTVQPKEVTRNLWTSDDNSIACPDMRSMKTGFARQALSFVFPTIWNKLPSDLRPLSKTLWISTFDRKLKTVLFKSAFGHVENWSVTIIAHMICFLSCDIWRIINLCTCLLTHSSRRRCSIGIWSAGIL